MLKTTFGALALASLASLASCGGDSTNDEYQQALAEENAAQAQAVSLAASSPCNAPTQCGVLTLSIASDRCEVPQYLVYSLVSPTADAASAAAANERSIADRVVTLGQPSACVASIPVPPTPACSANACVAAPPSN